MIYALSFRIYGRCYKTSRVITVCNQKGGAAKTTTAINLAAYIALEGNSVLLIDLDSQSAATQHFGFNFRATMHIDTIYDSLIAGIPLDKITLGTGIPQLKLAPSNINLSGGEYELYGVKNREYALTRALKTIQTKYDYVLIDTSPSLGTLEVNALAAADFLIIPILAEFLSLSGLSSFLKFVGIVQNKLHKRLPYKLLFSMFDKRLRLSREVYAEVEKHFKDKVFQTIIPRNVTVAEAAGHGQPIVLYNKRCKAAKAFEALSQEVLKELPKLRKGEKNEQ